MYIQNVIVSWSGKKYGPHTMDVVDIYWEKLLCVISQNDEKVSSWDEISF